MGYKVKRFSILREKEIAFSDRSRDLEWLNQNRTICYEIINV